jgi:NADPH-dependent 2,4-dienoyl-CoA reductase/sulfur reductase-like enzyme
VSGPARVVVVGASAGGLGTAEALRRLGHDGAITLVGDETHLPYDRPPLSKQLLRGEWGTERLQLRPTQAIADLDLDLRIGVRAAELRPADRVVVLAGGERLPYDELVVATGVRPRRLPGTDGLSNVHELRTVEDTLALKAGLRPGRELLVVGGGFIGAEAAATARALGVHVTLLEADAVPMAPVVGTGVGEHLAAVHRRHGVDIRTGVAVDEVLHSGGRATGVRLVDGSVVAADEILVAIGSQPATDWLTGCGLTLDQGLLCDAQLRAGPHVHAVGDVARWYNPLFETTMRVEHRTNAGEQALTVARNILDPGHTRPHAPIPYFWTDQYDLKLQGYGVLAGHDEAAVVAGDLTPGPDRARFLVAYRRGELLSGVLGAGMPPKELLGWRSRVAARTPWREAVPGEPAVA